MTEAEGTISQPQLRTCQIITLLIIGGALAFLAIALVLVLGSDRPAAPAGALPLVSIMAAVFMALTAGLSFLVPEVVSRTALRQLLAGNWQPPEGADPRAFPTFTAKLMTVYQTSLIVGLAMLEGGAFFLLMAYIIEAQLWAVALVAIPVGLMAQRFPIEARVRVWLDRQADALASLRQGG
jgi:hypothetical protein